MKGKAWLFVAVVLLAALASGVVFAKEAPGGEILPVDAGNYNDYGGGDSGWSSGGSDWGSSWDDDDWGDWDSDYTGSGGGFYFFGGNASAIVVVLVIVLLISVSALKNKSSRGRQLPRRGAAGAGSYAGN